MRTKTLLIAAAAMAVGVATSMAQTYSQNIVGYATVQCPAGKYVMVANPMSTGNDVLTNVVQGAPGASIAQIWSGSGWVGYTYSSLNKHWKSGAIVGDNIVLAPGVGFLLKSPSDFTNTFVGVVGATPGGGTATNALTGGVYAPVGSLLPYADVVTNAATINLTVGGASTIQQWDPVAQSYRPIFTYSSLSKVWKQGTTVTNPVIGVAEGFFIKPAGNTNWIETLQ